MIRCRAVSKGGRGEASEETNAADPLYSGLRSCERSMPLCLSCSLQSFARATGKEIAIAAFTFCTAIFSSPPLSPLPFPLCGILLRVPQGFQGFPQQSLAGAPPRRDGRPRGHLVQTANFFDARFVFSPCFLFSSLPPAPLVIDPPLKLSPQPLAPRTGGPKEAWGKENHSLWVCGF